MPFFWPGDIDLDFRRVIWIFEFVWGFLVSHSYGTVLVFEACCNV